MPEEKKNYELTKQDVALTNRPLRIVDKTFVDKLTVREDLKRMEELHRKGHLTAEELQEMLHLLTAVEPKFLNFTEWDRYAAAKFFTRVRSYIRVGIMLHNVQTHFDKGNYSPRAKNLFTQCFNTIDEAMMYIIDVFLYATRTSLSVGGYAFGKLADNQFDMPYNQPQMGQGIFKNPFGKGI